MSLEKIVLDILNSKKKIFLVYFITLVLFVLAILSFPTNILKAKMLPDKDSDSFSIYIDLKDGSSKYDTKKVVDCVIKNLENEENILNISAFLSQGQPIDFAGMVKQSSLKDKESQAELMINIKRFKDRDITSYNLVNIFKNQNTLVDIDILTSEDFKTYILNINSSKAIMSGIDLEHLKSTLYLAFEGMEIAVVNDKDAQSQIPIFLRLDDSKKLNDNSKEALNLKLNSLKIINNMGQMISISELVSIKESIKEPVVTSKNLKPLINVIAETSNDSQIYPLLNSREEMIEKFSNKYEIIKTNMLNLSFVHKDTKERFDLVFDGELQVTIDTFIDLGTAFIVALILIFLLMVMYYKNFALSGAIVLSSFISIIGVIFAHIIMDIFTKDIFYLTATSLIGFIALIGINSRNSTLIIDFAKQLVLENHLEVNEAIAKAAATRSKPIILTVLVLVFASSLIANDAVFGGLGVALIGGTLISYIVSMFFVPVVIRNSLKKIV